MVAPGNHLGGAGSSDTFPVRGSTGRMRFRQTRSAEYQFRKSDGKVRNEIRRYTPPQRLEQPGHLRRELLFYPEGRIRNPEKGGRLSGSRPPFLGFSGFGFVK